MISSGGKSSCCRASQAPQRRAGYGTRLVADSRWGHHGDSVVIFGPKSKSLGGRDVNPFFTPRRYRTSPTPATSLGPARPVEAISREIGDSAKEDRFRQQVSLVSANARRPPVRSFRNALDTFAQI
jgi:hypothetical protein